jgi:hypothetical protein
MKNALQKVVALNSFRSALVSLAFLSFVVPAITSGPAAAVR